MSKSKESRTFNISVVGLSGTEKDKGASGIGKSCLCNRFIRPKADDYHTEHITILSQIDFSGRVVNNDHFLYWGKATKTTEEGQDYVFNVVEQTEFIDDATYQAHRISVPQHYIKRAAATRLASAEKLMYICTDQLGIEHDFEQQPMPDGKLIIDGFLLCVDVSRVAQRSMVDQLKFTDKLFVQLNKSKKPILLLATKCDRADEQFLKDVQAFASSKKVNLPLLETSAQENINVSFAFVLLAQMIDKLKGKQKLISYCEAAKQAKEFTQATTQKYEALLKHQVKDYHALWNFTRRKMEDFPEYKQMVDTLGLKKAEVSFKEHLRRLKIEHIEQKREEYLQTLPKAFESLVPDLNEIESLSLAEFLPLVQSKREFGVWFVELSDLPWSESRHIDLPNDKRVPLDFLKECGSNSFHSHIQMLQTLRKKAEMKEKFKQLLESSSCIFPGKPWEEVYSLSAIYTKECYQTISEKERIDIYQDIQKHKIEKAKNDYQEMLLEHSETFADVDRNEAFNHDKIGEIMQDLEDDLRYKALRFVPAERDALILKHIFFVHHPTKESCFSRLGCVDLQVEQLLSNVVSKVSQRSTENLSDSRGEDKLGVFVFGKDGLGHELSREISRQSTGNKLNINDKNYALDLKVVDGDVAAFTTAMQNPCFNGRPGGYLCAFNSLDSLKCLTECLERMTNVSTGKRKDGLSGNIPIVLLLANHKDVANRTYPLLRQQAQQAANKYQVAFVDSSGDSVLKAFQEAQVKQALVHIATSCHQEVAPTKVIGRSDLTEADLYVTMCVMCGDPFTVDLVLTPFFESRFCTFGQPGQVDSVSLEMFLGAHRKKIKITVMSYHMATLRRDDLTHGHILVYSAKRKASMATMRAFLSDVPDVIPVQLLAITESQNEFFENAVAKELVSEGEHIASEIGGRFCTVPAQSHFHRQTEVFTPFFAEALEKRALVEEEFRFDPTMNVSSEALNQSGTFSSSSLSDSDDDDCQPPYSPASDETQLLPNMSRSRPMDLEGNSLPVSSASLPHDSERNRKVLPPKPAKPAERLGVSKLDPKLIEKINETMSKGPTKAQLSRAPLAHAEDTEIADVPAAAAADTKTWSMTKLFTRSRATLNGSDTEESATDQERRKGQPVVRRRSSYRYKSETLLRRQVYPSEVLGNGVQTRGDRAVAPIDGGRRTARSRHHADSAPLLSPGAEGSSCGIDNPAADLDDAPRLRAAEGGKKKAAKPKDSKLKPKKRKGKNKNAYFGVPLKDLVDLPDQPIPVFLKKCVEYIERNGLHNEGLYRVSGNKVDQKNILQQFEKDHNFDISSLNVTVHTITGALKSFFTELPDPLLPYNMQKSLADAVGITVEKEMLASLQDFVKKLPLVNYEVFKFIITHFYRVCQHSATNKMSEENLSICFWPTLIKPNFSDNTTIMGKMVSRTPIRPFIVHCPRIFHGRDDLPLGPDDSVFAAEALPAEGRLVDIEG